MADKLPAVDTKTVTTAGTPEALTTRAVQCRGVVITADDANTGVFYIVDSTTTSKKYPTDGFSANESMTLNVQDPRIILIDVSVSGETVSWIAI